MNYRIKQPYDSVSNLQRDVNDFFKRRAEDDELECRGAWIPNIDISETEDTIKLYAELPGVTKDDIKITVKDGLLSISWERKPTADQEKERFYRVERKFGDFCRQFQLSSQIDTNNVSAAFKDGVLSLTLSKREEAKAKEISIRTE